MEKAIIAPFGIEVISCEKEMPFFDSLHKELRKYNEAFFTQEEMLRNCHAFFRNLIDKNAKGWSSVDSTIIDYLCAPYVCLDVNGFFTRLRFVRTFGFIPVMTTSGENVIVNIINPAVHSRYTLCGRMMNVASFSEYLNNMVSWHKTTFDFIMAHNEFIQSGLPFRWENDFLFEVVKPDAKELKFISECIIAVEMTKERLSRKGERIFFKMDNFFVENTCGTTCCIAGLHKLVFGSNINNEGFADYLQIVLDKKGTQISESLVEFLLGSYWPSDINEAMIRLKFAKTYGIVPCCYYDDAEMVAITYLKQRDEYAYIHRSDFHKMLDYYNNKK